MTLAPRRSTNNRPAEPEAQRRNERDKSPKQAARPSESAVQPASEVDSTNAGSTSLPNWLDGLACADQVRPVGTDHGEPSQLGNMDHMSWELRTETVANDRACHEPSHSKLSADHAKQLAHYKNLLIRAQSASSTALHALHTQLHELQVAHDHLRAEHAGCRARQEEKRRDQAFVQGLSEDSLEGKVRSMSKQERMRMLGLIAEACDPSDISAQITVLERYKRSRFDILGRSGQDLAVSVISLLDLKDVLNLRAVSARYHELTSTPALWRELCKWLDDGLHGMSTKRTAIAEECCDWEDLYRGLHQREQNWRHGRSQKVTLLKGHTDYVTCLRLKGDTLISGSYDGSVRVWRIPSRSDPQDINPPTVISSKTVSCLDYWQGTQVIAMGHHDTGRVQVWKRVGSKWEAGHLLSGHLHGIRTIALNDRYLISAGADKAIVVWDYHTGEKITRFGQQTNICVGIHLIHDKVISVTVDGVIRCFDIRQRKMVAHYRLVDLCKNASLGGLDSNASVLWVEGEGMCLTCGTKTATVQLEWRSMLERQLQPKDMPTPSETPNLRSRRVSLGVVPQSPSSSRRPSPSTRTPSKGVSSLGISPVKTPTTVSPSTRGATSTPIHTSSLSTTTTSTTLFSPSPISKTVIPRSPLISSPRRAATPVSLPQANISSDPVTMLVPDFAIAPKVSAFLQTPEVERGAVDLKTGRMVLCQRFGLRSASRNIYIASQHDSEMTIVPLKGAWTDAFKEKDLGLPGKNPMSVVVDRDKMIYGCADVLPPYDEHATDTSDDEVPVPGASRESYGTQFEHREGSSTTGDDALAIVAARMLLRPNAAGPNTTRLDVPSSKQARTEDWTPKMSNTPSETGHTTFERTEADNNLVRLTGTLCDPCDDLIERMIFEYTHGDSDNRSDDIPDLQTAVSRLCHMFPQSRLFTRAEKLLKDWDEVAESYRQSPPDSRSFQEDIANPLVAGQKEEESGLYIDTPARVDYGPPRGRYGEWEMM